ncbi:MAG: hypothetical protein FJ031_02575 [Chloroflexi bacterium]|nr:hypothetical protein [Chloroflexota bacterium]
MQICYLLVFPESGEGNALAPQQLKVQKDAPYFQPVDIDLVSIGEETVLIEGYAVSVIRQRYDGCAQMIECRFDLQDPFASSVLQLRIKIQAALQSKYVPVSIRDSGLFEDYTILLVKTMKPSPEKWIEKNAAALAKFIRSQRETLDPAEIADILVSRTQYSANDMTVVDWEGAVIIAPNEDYDSDIALLKIGNYQLLRYRMLDLSIEAMLDAISETFFKDKGRPRLTTSVVRQIAEHKLEVMIDFERVEQNLLLIGDWYSAKLYEAIQSELYLKDWKDNLRSKLDNLEGIVGTIKDNFSLSLERIWGRVEMAVYMIMLVGYLYLFFADMGWIGP